MPKPIPKTEDVLRESEIGDAVRAEIGRMITGYRRRMLEVLPDLIDEFREQAANGQLPGLDVEAIRYRVHETERALNAGPE